MRRFRGGILWDGLERHTECGGGKLPYFFNCLNSLVSVSTLSSGWNRFVHSDFLRSLRNQLPPLRLSEVGKCRRGDREFSPRAHAAGRCRRAFKMTRVTYARTDSTEHFEYY